MQVLVIYHSRTGNTKQLAEAVADGVREVGEVKCVVKQAQEVSVEDFLHSQAIIAGSPVYFGSMAAELKDVFDRCVEIRSEMEGKVGAAFTTSGDLSGGKETTLLSILQAMLIYGMVVVGDPLNATGHYGVSCAGAPDQQTQDYARRLGRRVATVMSRLRAA